MEVQISGARTLLLHIVAGQMYVWSCAGYGKQLQGQEAQDPHPIAAATAAAGPATVDLLSGLPQKTDTSWLDSSGASIAAGKITSLHFAVDRRS